jgi:hypothetical protein
MWGGVGHRFKVVDEFHPCQIELGADLVQRHRPRQIGVDDRAVEAVAGTGDRGFPDDGRGKRLEEFAQDCAEVRVVGADVSFVLLQNRLAG